MGELRYFTFDSPFSRIGITASADGLLAFKLAQQSALIPPDPPPEFSGVVERLKAYFEGKKVCFDDIKIDLSSATPFQTKVWEAARSIPYGETRSYRWVAEQIGKPGAARAVGQALGKNPLPVIIPCHRVIASSGNLGGFRLGLDMKVMLLSLEQGRALKLE